MCGLAGASGPKINQDKLTILFLYNDSRGGDSCGIYDGTGLLISCGNKIGTNNKGYFHHNLPVWEIDVSAPYVLGHARAASLGIPVNEANAHPFEFEHIVGTHNGTIYSMKSLCEEYEVPFNESDSKSLYTIINKYHDNLEIVAEVLGKYIGAAALAWIDKESGKLHLYRGESPEFKNEKTIFEERPLYIGMDGKTLYYSSIEDSLKAISSTHWRDKSYYMPGNTILVFDNGKLVKSYDVNRNDAYMKFPSVKTHTSASTKTQSIFTIDKKGTEERDVLLEDLRNPDGGKVYMSGGRYFRNGHVIGSKAIAEFFVKEDGEIVYGKAEQLKDDYYLIQERSGEFVHARKCCFYAGHLFKHSKDVTDFKIDYLNKDNKVELLNFKIANYFENPVRMDLPDRLNAIKVISRYNKWVFSEEVNVQYLKEKGKITIMFPFSNTDYEFHHCLCVGKTEYSLMEPPINGNEELEEVLDEITVPFSIMRNEEEDELNSFGESLLGLLSEMESFLSEHADAYSKASFGDEIYDAYSEVQSTYEKLSLVYLIDDAYEK